MQSYSSVGFFSLGLIFINNPKMLVFKYTLAIFRCINDYNVSCIKRVASLIKVENYKLSPYRKINSLLKTPVHFFPWQKSLDIKNHGIIVFK